ncbi:MAG: hypothetical protein FWC20_03310 [Oscillospiraceae bacterium]|nr:hypothetical protein [Oscillospiraceae bacterium]MCL2278420.1 hypothetical protein [Oscillospiraceae bacterium]
MAGKKNEGKLKSMLERRGLIRKVEDNTGKSTSDTITRYNPEVNPDIKPIIDMPDDSSPVKVAPRQPVPGMSTPVFPEEQAIEEETMQAQAVTPEPVSRQYTPAAVEENPFSEEPSVPEPQPYTPPPAPPRPAPQAESLNPFRGERESAPTQLPEAEPAYTPQRSHVENYTDRYLSINELYDALALKPRKTDSVYLIEEYLKTLPDSLPDSSRRDIVNKIITASGFDYDLLMGDGVLRVKMLKEYAERFARHTDDYVAARHAELEALEQQIQRMKRLVENRKELHKKQFFTIEAEAQRLKEILTFISG